MYTCVHSVYNAYNAIDWFQNVCTKRHWEDWQFYTAVLISAFVYNGVFLMYVRLTVNCANKNIYVAWEKYAFCNIDSGSK